MVSLQNNYFQEVIMAKSTEGYNGLKLFGLPWTVFAIFSAIVIAATYLGVLPKGMAGCFAFMIVLGTILNEIGNRADRKSVV